MAKNDQGVIVAIHGVGTPAPGNILTDLSKLSPNTSYVRSDITEGGTTFARLVSDDGLVPDLIEVNWSDIKRPPRSIMGVAAWTVALSFALSRATLPWTKVRLVTGWFHTILFEAVILWVLFPVLLGLMHANLGGFALAIADAAVVGIAVVTLCASWNTTRTAQIAGVLTVVGLVALAAILWIWPEKTGLVNPVAVRIYGLAQIAAAVFIAFTAIEVALRRALRQITFADALARLAFAYVPLALLSALGSCIWAVTLNIVVRLRHPAVLDQNWQTMFLQNLGYDLASVELAMASATAALGVFVFAAMLAYLIYCTINPEKQGAVAHRAIFGLLILTPLLLAIPGTLLALTSPYFGQIWRPILPPTLGQNVLVVYTWSAMRVVPWLLARVTGVATLLDVLADVVFYITDRELRFSSLEVCNKRLALILQYAQSHYTWIHVVAHSQGSVIAHRVLSELVSNVPIVLTTVGCPLRTLYERYLGWPITLRSHWRNLFRSGDYVGGPVNLVGIDENIGSGGHTGYWEDSRISGRLSERPPFS
jgi:hypothetical protein